MNCLETLTSAHVATTTSTSPSPSMSTARADGVRPIPLTIVRFVNELDLI